jgi:hypothetical protein
MKIVNTVSFGVSVDKWLGILSGVGWKRQHLDLENNYKLVMLSR